VNDDDRKQVGISPRVDRTGTEREGPGAEGREGGGRDGREREGERVNTGEFDGRKKRRKKRETRERETHTVACSKGIVLTRWNKHREASFGLPLGKWTW